jgi:hypothetical protein
MYKIDSSRFVGDHRDYQQSLTLQTLLELAPKIEEDVSHFEPEPVAIVSHEKPLAFDLSDELKRIQQLLDHGKNPEEYWQFFNAQAKYYALESYAKLGAVTYTHDLVIDQNFLKQKKLKLWIGPMGKGAYESYLDGAEKVTDDPRMRWYKDRCFKEAYAIIDWEEKINKKGSDAIFVDISPAPFEVSPEELDGTMFGNHSFIRVHQVVLDKNGRPQLFSRAHRTELSPEGLEVVNKLLTNENVVCSDLLGRFSQLNKNWLNGIKNQDSICDIRDKDIAILVEQIIRRQEKIEANNNKNSQKNLKNGQNIESNNSSESVTKEEMEKYFATLEPVLKKTFNAMIKLINCHPEDKGFFKEIIETEFRTWEMMLQDLISGTSTISESTKSHTPRSKVEAELNAMYARIQAQPYTPGSNSCGAGSGFGSVRLVPQYSGFVNPYGAISEIFKNGKNYLEDPNLCRCAKGGSRPHFHCPGRIRFGKNKGRPCRHPIRVGFGIKNCPICREGKKC